MEQLPPRAAKQRALFTAFAEQNILSRGDIREQGFGDAVFRALREQGLLVTALPTPPSPERETPLTLTKEQSAALTSIRDHLGQFSRFLLDGITGSGKTEVYLQAIAATLERGQQCLVLVPEIGLTPQTLRRFERRFPGRVVAMHSGMSDGDRLRHWQAARRGDCDIVLGTRSAIFAELPKLGLVIVDEEHDSSYKQQDGWRYNARDIAVKRAANHQCPVILGSATPSLDSLHNADQGRYQLLRLTERAGNAQQAPIRLLDIRQQPLHEGLSDALLHACEQTLAAGNQVLLFLNRRGFAPHSAMPLLRLDCRLYCLRCADDRTLSPPPITLPPLRSRARHAR